MKRWGDRSGRLRRSCAGLVVPASAADTDARVAAPAGFGAEQHALAFLRSRKIDVSHDLLTRALQNADIQVVAALLDAGVPVGAAAAPRANGAVTSGLAVVCQNMPVPADRVGQALTLLVDHGFPIGYSDEMGNTILLSAAQFCPAPVVAWIIALGAPVDPVNRQRFTPLKMALVSGKWDVAAALVDHGARITMQDLASCLSSRHRTRTCGHCLSAQRNEGTDR